MRKVVGSSSVLLILNRWISDLEVLEATTPVIEEGFRGVQKNEVFIRLIEDK
jgi:hypothetical protein